MRKRRVLFLALMLLATASLIHTTLATEQSEQSHFVAVLKGQNQVPPVETHAQGVFLATLSPDGSQLTFKLHVANIEEVTASHIHVGASDTNGPVVAFLFSTESPTGRVDGPLSTGTITAANLVGPLHGESLSALIDAINKGEAYVNVHTTVNPGGEIRGQIFLGD